jgi:hypothetical protein
MARPVSVVAFGVLGAVILSSSPAWAIPAFARKYGTSCLTCHTVYPKLTPFGEAFRRNGYRFPGIDSDYVKQDTVPLGQEANKKTFPNSVWPDTIPISAPIAFGVNGQLRLYPDKNASVPRANNDIRVAVDELIAEGHMWVGAALDESTTVWGELTVADGGAEVEHAQVLFNDLVGPKHAFNLIVGKGFPTITSFGPHSSYLADQMVTNFPVTSTYAVSTDAFVLVDNYTGLEVNGVLGKMIDYSAGWNAGKNTFTSSFNSQNWYAHAGVKLGGMPLDGEGFTGPTDAMQPWAETALTLDAFVYRSSEHFPDPTANTFSIHDKSMTYGGDLRGQLGSAELDAGYYWQRHERGTAGLARVDADVAWGELSYVLFPWMVPAVRVERLALRPTDGSSVSDWHLMPGIAFLIRANIKVVAVVNLELGKGYPVDAGGGPLAWSGGSGDWGSFVLSPNPDATATSTRNELESIAVFMAWAL